MTPRLAVSAARLLGPVLLLLAGACGDGPPAAPAARGPTRPTAPLVVDARPSEGDARMADGDTVELSDAEWRARLTPEQYEVMRRKGTERPFTGRYWDTTTEGTYRCLGCGLDLFESTTKFDAGCGWPSFTAPAAPDAIVATPDDSHRMQRTEITCRRCGAHLGHVFEDGPAPTGLRYCINSASLDLDAADAADGKDPDEK